MDDNTIKMTLYTIAYIVTVLFLVGLLLYVREREKEEVFKEQREERKKKWTQIQ